MSNKLDDVTISIDNCTSYGLDLTASTDYANIICPITLGNITISDYWITPNTEFETLKITGNAQFEGDVTIKGKSLASAIENIEKRLAILQPNPELEERWEKLKSLGDQYRQLEAEILEKEKIWATLKK